jgi:hypothetical protein
LLHFTKCAIPFPKSDCKDDKDHVLFCGTGKHSEDCHGERCVAGYMREHNFCRDYAKSGNYYFNHLDKKDIALKNAAWLRYKMRGKLNEQNQKIYNINPYSNVDVLVKRLFGIKTNYIWTGLNETVETTNFSISAQQTDGIFSVKLSNHSNKTIIFNQTNYQNHFKMLSIADAKINLILEKTVIIPSNTTQSVLLRYEETGNTLIFKIEEDEVFIELID